ncbi:MAG: hypothetical protein R3D71_05790 [Rickettsiales bacterium]
MQKEQSQLNKLPTTMSSANRFKDDFDRIFSTTTPPTNPATLKQMGVKL